MIWQYLAAGYMVFATLFFFYVHSGLQKQDKTGCAVWVISMVLSVLWFPIVARWILGSLYRKYL